jgi:thiol:disulfide interchange protein DsbC
MRLQACLLLPLLLVACAPPAPETTAPAEVPVSAAPPPVADVAVAPGDLEAVKAQVALRLPSVTVDAIRATPLPGVYELQSGMNFGYISGDGRFLIEGDLNDLVSGQRLTENRRREARAGLMAAIGPDQAIEYAPAGTPKYTITVFTDIDCGYCRKLHQHMAEYNADGIAVRYVFFPRSGPNTESFYKAERVWCSADRQVALNKAKAGENVEADTGCANPIGDHLRLAGELGLRGTPAIVLPDGELIPGYQPPAALLQILAEHAASAAKPG